MNETLVGPITMEEVKNAVFQLGSTKAIGSDELKGQFFQHRRADIQGNVLQEIKNFF